MTDLQDRISPSLVNNSFKRVFLKKFEGVITAYLSLKVFDSRRNLPLRKGSSVLICGAFEWLFCPEGREFEQANLQKFNCPEGLPRVGGMLNFRIDQRISVQGKYY